MRKSVKDRLLLLSTLLASLMLVMQTPLSGALEIYYSDLDNEPEWFTPMQPEPGDLDAIQGGILKMPLSAFPDSLRRFGPGTPNRFTKILNDLQLPLAYFHEDYSQPVPLIAKGWFWNEEKRELTIDIRSDARWSDGASFTTQDIAFTLRFLSRPDNRTPYQAKAIKQSITSVTIHDLHRVTLRLKNNIDYRDMLSLRPMPAHFYTYTSFWPTDYDNQIEPNTGPYQITQFDSGDKIVFQRVNNWWAERDRFFINRFNPDSVVFHHYDPRHVYYDKLKAGQLDMFHYKQAYLSAEESSAIDNLCSLLPIDRYRIQSNLQFFRVLVKNQNESTQKHQPDSHEQAELSGCLSDTELETPETVIDQFHWSKDEPLPKHLRRQQCRQAMKAFEENQFDYLVLTLQAGSKEEAIDYLQSRTEYSDHMKFQAVKITDLKQDYALWRWIKIPNDPLTRVNPLDPFDPTHGGMFWIDPQVKHNTLSRNFWRLPAPGVTYGYDQPSGSNND